jgi:hypothetical protein
VSKISYEMRTIAENLPRRVAARAAPIVEAEAKRRSPVRTGALRRSVVAYADGPRVVLSALYYARYVGVYAAGFALELMEAIRAL